MKYFTPDLYVRLNEASDDEAEAEYDEWEQVSRRYGRRYKKIESQLPDALRRFHDEQCLHDADWCGLTRLPTHALSPDRQELAIVVRQVNTLVPEFKNTLTVLKYGVVAPPLLERPVEAAVFTEAQPEWMYDEIDLVGAGVFSHSILVSNGLVVTIQFNEFHYYVTPLLDAARNGEATTAPARSASA